MDTQTEWGDVFDALTSAEQECVRDTFDGDTLESVLARPVMSEAETPEEWVILIFSCLAPETARAVFLSTMVAGVGEDEAFELDADTEACLAEWVAGLDVVATMLALSVDDTEVTGDVTTAFLTCNRDLIVSLMLEETGLTLEDLSEEEASCLREWVTGTDWTNLLTGSTDDPSDLMGFAADLIECAPDMFISSMLEETGMTLEDLSEEEASCLREWITGTDWTSLLTGSTDDPALLFDFLPGLFDCVPDLAWSAANARPWDEVVDEAAPVEIGVATRGELEYPDDRDFFTFEATEGEYYELDVTLGTLQDSVLDLYDADGNPLAGNDDYGDSTASRLIWQAPGTGTYHVEITSFGTGTGTYTLTITISDITDDHPNSTANATPVELGVGKQGELEYEDDSDFFAFEAAAGEYYELDVTLGTLQDSVLDLYDTDGIWLARNDDYDDSTASRLIWQAPTTGTYHVQVTSFDTSTGTYTLTIIISDIADDHPNSTANATPVEVDVSAHGELEYEGDGDFFAFEATAGESYELDVTLGTLQDSVVDIFDADGNWLDGNDDYGDSTASRLTWIAPSTGTYYVQVTDFGSGTGTYTLTIATAL